MKRKRKVKRRGKEGSEKYEIQEKKKIKMPQSQREYFCQHFMWMCLRDLRVGLSPYQFSAQSPPISILLSKEKHQNWVKFFTINSLNIHPSYVIGLLHL